MKLKFLPQEGAPLSLVFHGEMPVIDGALLDLSHLAEGDMLPAVAIACDRITEPVAWCAGGEIVLPLTAPGLEDILEVEADTDLAALGVRLAETPVPDAPAIVVDWSQRITAADRAAAAAARRAGTVKAECSRRITDVLDMKTTINIQGAVMAGALNEAELATFRAGRAWVHEMQLTCRRLIADETADPARDDSWPVPPEDLRALAALY